MKQITKYYSENLYPISIIKRAVHDYSGICRIRIVCQDHQLECEFTSDCQDIDEIGNEFDNYLIELMQEHQTNELG